MEIRYRRRTKPPTSNDSLVINLKLESEPREYSTLLMANETNVFSYYLQRGGANLARYMACTMLHYDCVNTCMANMQYTQKLIGGSFSNHEWLSLRLQLDFYNSNHKLVLSDYNYHIFVMFKAAFYVSLGSSSDFRIPSPPPTASLPTAPLFLLQQTIFPHLNPV